MERQLTLFIRNVLAMLFANGISFVISALVTLIIPKFLSIENYAYVQLYIFYTSYISYLHYGWVDGIRLRYGGIYYNKINKPLFNFQIISYCFIQILISCIVIIIILNGDITGNNFIALICVGICMLIRLPRLMPQYILEMSNRIQECARITMIERLSYLLLIIIVIILKKISVASVLFCDLFGQALTAIYAFWCCKDILKTKPDFSKHSIVEIWNNISVGIKLTIANISSILIIGIVRLFIENQWDVETFGKISLTISISNLLMVFIRAVAMVMFPTLKRINEEKLAAMYGGLRIGIMIPLLGLLTLYFPLFIFISNWLPQYSESLKYMILLFPMCIFESKMSMLIETYLKAMRYENWLLKINVFTVCLSVITSIFTCYIFHDLTLVVLSIVILLAFRCIVSENVILKKFKINMNKEIILEICLVILFILFNWIIGGLLGISIYILAYCIYLYIMKNDLIQMIRMLRRRKLYDKSS